MPPERNLETDAPATVTSPGGTVETGVAPAPAAPDVTDDEVKAFQAANPGVTEDAARGSVIEQKRALAAGKTPAIAAAGLDLGALRSVMSEPQARSYDTFQRITEAAKTDPGVLNRPEALREIYGTSTLQDQASARPDLNLVPGDLPEEDRSAIGQYMTAIGKEVQRLGDPSTQQKTFVNLFEDLRKEAGLEDVDTRLFDIQRIIDGTKDDIRNELQRVGGLVTDSAVEYLAGVRNKVLVKESERLQKLKEDKEKYVDRMVQLGKMDREEAEKRFERAFDLQGKAADLEFKLEESGAKRSKEYMDFLERQQDNARQRVSMLISSGGLRNFSDDQLALLEEEAGFVPGDLAGVREALLDKREDEITRLELATERFNLAAERAAAAGGGGTTKQTVTDVNAELQNYARMKSGGQDVPAWADKYLVEKRKDGVGTGEYEALEITKGSLETFNAERERIVGEETAATQTNLNDVDFVLNMIKEDRAAGVGYQEIRNAAAAAGVPTPVYQQALRKMLEAGL